ncbi:SUPPRESSOR OF ABI3-5 [Olea europaea subsp. europaea]|uniref:SUPPRESSOR OF ABI3-5 n=1 Tax=Olea europaea subsp. europaea TaxID=158383 RepID=A0A8S0TF15_OLEEU|nr:SUPPRESSOR OF ABI3-5 [Olea europaea subsp. europaea]
MSIREEIHRSHTLFIIQISLDIYSFQQNLNGANYLGDKLGEWIFKSRSRDAFHEGYMFPMLVTEEFDVWLEKNVCQLIWGLGKDESGMVESVQVQVIDTRAVLGNQPEKLDPKLEVQAGDSYKAVIQKKAIARFREIS